MWKNLIVCCLIGVLRGNCTGEKDVMNVGVFVQMSNSEWKSVVVSAKLALDDLNERNGHIVESVSALLTERWEFKGIVLDVEDCDPIRLKKLIVDENLDWMIGPACEGHGVVLHGLAFAAMEFRIPMLAYEAVHFYEKWNTFAIKPMLHEIAPYVVEAYKILKHKQVVVLHESSESARILTAKLQRLAFRTETLKIMPIEYDPGDRNSMQIAVDAAVRSGMRSIFCIASSDSLEELLSMADWAGMLSPNFLWTFAESSARESLHSAMSRVIGSLRIGFSGSEGLALQNRKEWEALNSWWDNVSPDVVESLVNHAFIDTNLKITDAASLAYDCVLSGAATILKHGEISALSLSKLQFDGTSGLVVFDKNGNRVAASMTPRISNIRSGYSVDVAEWLGEAWGFTKEEFIFADRSNVAPLDSEVTRLAGLNLPPRGYHLGDHDVPVCWITYLDPLHSRYNDARPEIMNQCPIDIDAGFSDSATLPAIWLEGESRFLRVFARIGSPFCPNAIGDCEFDVDFSNLEKYPKLNVHVCAENVPFCNPFNVHHGSPLLNLIPPWRIGSKEEEGIYESQRHTSTPKAIDTSRIMLNFRLETTSMMRIDFSRLYSNPMSLEENGPGSTNCFESKVNQVQCPEGTQLTIGNSEVESIQSLSLIESEEKEIILRVRLPNRANVSIAKLEVCDKEIRCQKKFSLLEGRNGELLASVKIATRGEFRLVASVQVQNSGIVVRKEIPVEVISPVVAADEEDGGRFATASNFSETKCWRSRRTKGAVYEHRQKLSKCPSDVFLGFLNAVPGLMSSSALKEFVFSNQFRLGSSVDPLTIDEGKYKLWMRKEAKAIEFGLRACAAPQSVCSPFYLPEQASFAILDSPTQFLKKGNENEALNFFVETSNFALKDGRYALVAHGTFYTDSGDFRWDVSTSRLLEISEHTAEDLSHIPLEVQIYVLGVFSVLATLVMGLAGWTFLFRKHVVLRTAQWLFLSLILLGSLLIDLMLPLFIVEDTPERRASEDGGNPSADFACELSPWIYALGFSIFFAAFQGKLEKAIEMKDGTVIHRIPVEYAAFRKWLGVSLGAPVFLLSLWALKEPRRYRRINTHVDMSGFPKKSVAGCYSSATPFFVATILIWNIGLLAVASVSSFRVSNLRTPYSEMRYISILVFSAMQILTIMLPVLFLMKLNGTNRAILMTTVLFPAQIAILVFVFLPKILIVHTGRRSALRMSLHIDETADAKLSPTNSPERPESFQSRGSMRQTVTPMAIIRPISSNWVEPSNNTTNNEDSLSPEQAERIQTSPGGSISRQSQSEDFIAKAKI